MPTILETSIALAKLLAESKDSAKNYFVYYDVSNLDVLKKAMTKPVVTDSLNVTVGGLSGVRVEIYGNMNGEAIYFSEEVIERVKTGFTTYSDFGPALLMKKTEI